MALEETLDDLGGENLDGFEVFEERDGDVGAARACGVTELGVADAEVFATEGPGVAGASGHGEGAAADGGWAKDGVVGNGLGGGGHIFLSEQESGVRSQESGVSDQKSVISDQKKRWWKKKRTAGGGPFLFFHL
jgi:hypothetical protein